MRIPCARIASVEPGSLAARAGLQAGEVLRRVNGRPLRDMIDYEYAVAEEYLDLEVVDEQGRARHLIMEKDYEDDLGLTFTAAVFDGMRLCGNHCIFCFVDQMAPDLRPSLYLKDDDYRLSFLYGNYITLTNLTEADYARILGERISPLYISVHSLDPEIHRHLLGRQKPFPLWENLQRLAAAGIYLHAQIVLVPGYNDGDDLRHTVERLASLGEMIVSIALVPVGLTRLKNPALRPVNRQEALTVIDYVTERQKEFLKERGSRLLFAADEFYLLAAREIPAAKDYEEYPQIENGVGLIRRFWQDFKVGAPKIKGAVTAPLTFITGVAGIPALRPVLAELRRHRGIDCDLLAVPNRFFGRTVTVTGLLTGVDIVSALQQRDEKGRRFLLPDILLKHGEEVLLDGLTVAQMREETGADIDVVDSSGRGLAAYLAKMTQRPRKGTER